MFIVEGLPTFITGFIVLTYLTDGPKDATWLNAEERSWLVQRLAAEIKRRLIPIAPRR